MSRIYYVVGYADTRRDCFLVRGVTTSKAKADKFKTKLASDLYANSRQWVEIKEVNGI